MSSVKSFRGGIHPDEQKDMSRGGVPQPVPAPDTVVIPLCQHIGAACKPLVAVGDAVLMGQKIGDGEGRCSPVHSSVSGTVTAIEERAVPSGGKVPCIIIKNDHKDTRSEMKGVADYMSLDAKTVAALVRECGVVGMGGAAYPTDSKIGSTAGKTKDVLINACECEPYITSDDTLMCTCAGDVIGGARLLAKALGAEKSIIAVEDNKPEAIEALRAEAGDEPLVEIRVLQEAAHPGRHRPRGRARREQRRTVQRHDHRERVPRRDEGSAPAGEDSHRHRRRRQRA